MSFLAIQGESQWVETLSPYNKIYEQLTNLTFVFEYMLNLLKRQNALFLQLVPQILETKR